MWGVFLFAGVLFLFEMVQGTDPFFAGCVFLYLLIGATAFNISGGLSRASGAFIFFQMTLTLVFGLVMKVILWEPADSNLRAPRVTILANLGVTCGLLVAAMLNQKFKRKRPILDDLLTPSGIRQTTFGCITVAVVLIFVGRITEAAPGSVLSALQRANLFLPLGILLGTQGVIVNSGGRRSINGIVAFACVFSFVDSGLLQYSKEGLFSGLVAWAIVVAAMGYRLSVRQVAFIMISFGIISYYLVPYAQGGRNDRDSPGSSLDKAINNLSRIDEFRAGTAEVSNDLVSGSSAVPHYFGTSVNPILERLQMVSWDDAVIAISGGENSFGYAPLIDSIYNIVPHFIWPSKPSYHWDNTFAHRIGLLADDDLTTGVSFSPVAQSYAMDGWRSVFLAAPLVFLVTFLILDSVTGDVRQSPWGLFYTLMCAHVAPEGMLGGAIYLATFYAPVLIMVAYTTKYVMPIVGSLLSPKSRAVGIHTKPVALTGNTRRV